MCTTPGFPASIRFTSYFRFPPRATLAPSDIASVTCLLTTIATYTSSLFIIVACWSWELFLADFILSSGTIRMYSGCTYSTYWSGFMSASYVLHLFLGVARTFKDIFHVIVCFRCDSRWKPYYQGLFQHFKSEVFHRLRSVPFGLAC